MATKTKNEQMGDMCKKFAKFSPDCTLIIIKDTNNSYRGTVVGNIKAIGIGVQKLLNDHPELVPVFMGAIMGISDDDEPLKSYEKQTQY